MKTKKNTLLLTVILSLSCLSVSAETINELQNWSMITVTKDFTEKWSLYFELQNRLRDNLTDEDIFFIRPAIVYKPNKLISLWQGYSWDPNITDDQMINEHRIWQQIDINKTFASFETFAWMRLEERFIEGADTVSLRDRFRVGFKLPLFKLETWKFVTFDELFVNLYDVKNGPQAGFDQNWAFVGIEKIFNPHTSLTTGYQMTYFNRVPNLISHSINFLLNIKL